MISSIIGRTTPSKRAGVIYSMLAVAFFGVSFLLGLFAQGETSPQWYVYLTFSAAPIAFLTVLAWYFNHVDGGLCGFLKTQKCRPKYYFIAFAMQLGLFPLGELNNLFLEFLTKCGYKDTPLTLPSTEGIGLVGVLLVVAVLPAIMEEIFFRGVLQRELKGFPFVVQVLLCGGMFALYHQNPAQTVYQAVCGVAFALVAVKAGSFFPTVLSHFINNAVIVILYACGVNGYPLPVYNILLIVSGLSLVGVSCYLCIFDGKKEERKEGGSYKQFFACVALGTYIFGASWLATLLAGL